MMVTCTTYLLVVQSVYASCTGDAHVCKAPPSKGIGTDAKYTHTHTHDGTLSMVQHFAARKNAKVQPIDSEVGENSSIVMELQEEDVSLLHGGFRSHAEQIKDFAVNFPNIKHMRTLENDADWVSALMKNPRIQCPPQEHPSLLYNHIKKTGGSAMHYVLRAAIGSHEGSTGKDYVVEDPEGLRGGELNSADKQKYFVVGMVRRPCDHVLSQYVQKLIHRADQFSKEGFKNFTMNLVNTGSYTGKGPQGRGGPTLMSAALEERYGAGDNVHCMMRTHMLKYDFLSCARKFQACGGALVDNGANLEAKVSAALEKATSAVRSQGRSVGDHPPCSEMFDSEMTKGVLQSEQSLINKYNLGNCCSSDSSK